VDMVRVTEPLGVWFERGGIPDRVIADAAARGTAAHAACAAYARRLPVLVDDAARPYFESFRVWFDRYVKRVLFVEEAFEDREVYFIKGHPDIVAEMIDNRVRVIDYKTPQAESKTWRCQLSAYRWLVSRRLRVEDIDAMALILSANGGSARGIPYQYKAEDFAAYVAALTAFRYFRK